MRGHGIVLPALLAAAACTAAGSTATPAIPSADEVHSFLTRVAAASGDEVTFIGLPDTGHFEIVDPRAAQWRHVRDAIDEALGIASLDISALFDEG